MFLLLLLVAIIVFLFLYCLFNTRVLQCNCELFNCVLITIPQDPLIWSWVVQRIGELTLCAEPSVYFI